MFDGSRAESRLGLRPFAEDWDTGELDRMGIGGGGGKITAKMTSRNSSIRGATREGTLMGSVSSHGRCSDPEIKRFEFRRLVGQRHEWRCMCRVSSKETQGQPASISDFIVHQYMSVVSRLRFDSVGRNCRPESKSRS